MSEPIPTSPYYNPGSCPYYNNRTCFSWKNLIVSNIYLSQQLNISLKRNRTFLREEAHILRKSNFLIIRPPGATISLRLKWDKNYSYRDDNVSVAGLNCTPPAIDDFPKDFFTEKQRQDGGIVVHILVSLYLFAALAVVCDKFFVPAVEKICHGRWCVTSFNIFALYNYHQHVHNICPQNDFVNYNQYLCPGIQVHCNPRCSNETISRLWCVVFNLMLSHHVLLIHLITLTLS